jgi:glycosyltransferase involved in cell wall biosynthesis
VRKKYFVPDPSLTDGKTKNSALHQNANDLKKTPSICFVSRSIHHLLLNSKNTRMGGAELQQQILSDALAARGWDVSFITERVDCQTRISLTPNITVYTALDFTKGNKYIRKLILLPLVFWRTLKKVNADKYYYRNPSYLCGINALFCKLYKKPFIIAGANNWNFQKGKEQNLHDILEKLLTRFGIRIADRIIAQNGTQAKLIKQNYHKDSVVMYNLFHKRPQRKHCRLILWTARIEAYKRPMLFIEIAKSFPEHEFVMVGGKGHDNFLAKKVEKEASRVQNLSYLGHQPFDNVERLFNQTLLFINTSIPDCEGFPTTFLQAWSRGIPVISFFDIDKMISVNRLGLVVRSPSEIPEAIRKLISSTLGHNSESQRIQSFFDSHFEVESQINFFIRTLTKCFSQRGMEP